MASVSPAASQPATVTFFPRGRASAVGAPVAPCAQVLHLPRPAEVVSSGPSLGLPAAVIGAEPLPQHLRTVLPAGLLVKPAPARHWRWLRNALLGASLSFADAGVLALRPVAFVWKNLTVVAQGVLYLALPLVPSLMLLHHVPQLGQAYAPNTVGGVAYLAGLYISCAFVMMLGAFTAGFCWKGTLQLMDHFARRGQEAFFPVR